MTFNKALVGIALIVVCSSAAYAQQAGPQGQQGQGQQGQGQQGQAQPTGGAATVEKDVLDPTSSLMSFGFRSITTTNYYGIPGSSHQIQFQPAIPFIAWGKTNILRISLPYNTGGVPGSGLADVTIFDLVVFPAGGGRFAIGPVVNFASNPVAREDRVQAGPALGYVGSKGKWTLGILNQNLFGSDTKFTAIQPLVAYSLGNGWALAAGDAQYSVDWNRGEFVNIPLGIQLGKIFKMGNQLARWTINPEYNARSIPGSPHWTIRFNFLLLVPSK